MKSRSHEIGTLNCCIALKFDRHIGSTAAEVPVKFQSDRTILNTNLAASRLYEILRKEVFSDIETGPCVRCPSHMKCLYMNGHAAKCTTKCMNKSFPVFPQLQICIYLDLFHIKMWNCIPIAVFLIFSGDSAVVLDVKVWNSKLRLCNMLPYGYLRAHMWNQKLMEKACSSREVTLHHP